MICRKSYFSAYSHNRLSTAILGYLKVGTNAHDDACDALIGAIEQRDYGYVSDK